MMFYFWLGNIHHENIYIDGQEVWWVETYKYFGININNKLDWHIHASYVISKIKQIFYFVRKLNYFKVDRKLSSLFCVSAWGENAVQEI